MVQYVLYYIWFIIVSCLPLSSMEFDNPSVKINGYIIAM